MGTRWPKGDMPAFTYMIAFPLLADGVYEDYGLVIEWGALKSGGAYRWKPENCVGNIERL